MHNSSVLWLTASLQFLLVLSSASTTYATLFPLQNATATFSQTSFAGQPIGQAIDGNLGDQNGWAIYEGPTDGMGAIPGLTNPRVAAFETVSDISFAGGASLTFTLQQLFYIGTHNIGRFRLSATTDARSEFADGLPTGGDVTAAWTELTPLSATTTGSATLSILGDNSILASGSNPITSIYTVTAFAPLIGITGFRLEVLADASFPDSGPGRNSNGNFVLTEFQVATPSLTGDYNANGRADAADYTIWRDTLGSTTNLTANGNGNTVIDAGDYDVWKQNFGQPAGSSAIASGSATVPEPAALVLFLVGTLAYWTWYRARLEVTMHRRSFRLPATAAKSTTARRNRTAHG